MLGGDQETAEDGVGGFCVLDMLELLGIATPVIDRTVGNRETSSLSGPGSAVRHPFRGATSENE